VMDVFARVCEALREDDLRRLRSWAEQPQHRARFTTWLVTVVRHLTVDWFRHRDGELTQLRDHRPRIGQADLRPGPHPPDAGRDSDIPVDHLSAVHPSTVRALAIERVTPGPVPGGGRPVSL